MGKLKQYLKLMRVKQWIKNLFVFMAIIFSDNVSNQWLLFQTICAFLAFCMISSFIYIVNDMIDYERDRLHPTKHKRPIASGCVSMTEALILAGICFWAGLGLGIVNNWCVVLVLLFYIINNIIYSYIGKNHAIIDVFQISFGFMLRVVAGAMAIWVQPSKWLILCSFFLTMFLGFGKRRGEMVLLDETQNHTRKSLVCYSVPLLERYLTISLSCTTVFYALYTVIGAEFEYMYISNTFVIYALLRYYYLLMENRNDGNPSDLVISDGQLWVCMILWAITCVIVTRL